ncbi:OmpA family protein [Micropruina sp.]|uniref:OmpA family protein n=1 Tax=Micropruina sp. TaxID=2737536 RepID=UPI0039E23ADF
MNRGSWAQTCHPSPLECRDSRHPVQSRKSRTRKRASACYCAPTTRFARNGGPVTKRGYCIAILLSSAVVVSPGCSGPPSPSVSATHPPPPVRTVPPPPLGPPVVWEGALSSDALFDYNSHQLRRDALATLSDTYRVATGRIASREALTIFTRGYADGVGPENDNMRLSGRRAEAVAQRLESLFQGDRGRPRLKVVVVSCGQTGTVNGLQSIPGKNEPRRRAVAVAIYKGSVIEHFPNLKREALTC